MVVVQGVTGVQLVGEKVGTMPDASALFLSFTAAEKETAEALAEELVLTTEIRLLTLAPPCIPVTLELAKPSEKSKVVPPPHVCAVKNASRERWLLFQ